MTIKSIVPCSGWYYTAKGSREEDIVFEVAAWALAEGGDVIGLIVVSDAVTSYNVARLVMPPRIGGTYVPESRLTKRQRLVARLE